MQVLIFALLALAVSADNYGYSSYLSDSSYPSSYSSSYGGGYGSSLYGSSYGSGIGYGVGGIGQSYYSGSGNLGGYAASYRPSVTYQTERYSYSYPYGTAEAYKTGSYGHSTSRRPAKVVYTPDFPGTEGPSGYQQDAPVIAGVEKYIVAPMHTSAHGSDAGSWQRVVGQEQTTGDLSGIQFAQEVAGIGAKDFESAPSVDAAYGGTKDATLPKVPARSFTESGAVGKSGARGSSTTGGGSQVSFTKDLPKVVEHSGSVAKKTTGHSDDIATKTTSHNFEEHSPQRTIAIAPKVPAGSFTESGAVGKGSEQGSSTAQGGRSQVSFTKDLLKTDAHSSDVATKTTGHRSDKLSPQRTIDVAPKVPTGTFGVSGSEVKSGGLKTGNTAGHSQVSFVQDFSKATGQSKQFEVKPEIQRNIPVSGGITSQVPTGSFGVSRSGVKSGGLRTGNTASHSQVSFVQDFSKTTGQSKQFEVKPEIQRIIPVSGGIASQRISGQSFGTAPKTGTQVIRQAQEVSFIQRQKAVSRHSGHRVVGQKQIVPFFDKRTTGGVPSAKQSAGYIHRTGSVYQRGTPGFSTAAGPQISFVLGGTELYPQERYAPASINNLVPVIPAARQHSGYLHRTGSIHRTQAHSFSTGPQVSFIQRQTVQRQPAIVPKQSFGYQRVVGAVSKNTAQGFATASGPSRISFIQDFSKVSGHKTSAIKPEISTFSQFDVPAFPGTITSQEYQPGKINKASIASKSTQNPLAVVKAPKQPVVQQATFTEFDSQSPTHASYYGSAEGHKDGDKSIFIEGPAAGFADGYAVDYKHNIASVESVTGDKLSSFIVVPETTFIDDKSSVLKYTSAAGGVQHLSEVAPTGTFVEDKGSFYQLSHGSPDSGVATHERYETQVPVL